MMRFPLRLTADLTIARLSQKLRTKPGRSPILLLNPMTSAGAGGHDSGKLSFKSKPGTELLDRVRRSSAPVVWIGGAEPLLHPEMGQLTRCIAGIGRHVFLETDGALLRRRIHEFRPVSRLFLVLKLHGLETVHDLRARLPGAFQAAMEGLRVARLSGFLTCVHARIDEETKLSDVAELIRHAKTLDVDGVVISRAGGGADSSNRSGEALRWKTAQARKLIGNRWWEFFSQLVEPVVGGDVETVRSAENNGAGIEAEADTNEEGVRIA
jgi:MoaA/NifB/PqqE/SkfB family radical SAM enzyme